MRRFGRTDWARLTLRLRIFVEESLRLFAASSTFPPFTLVNWYNPLFRYDNVDS